MHQSPRARHGASSEGGGRKVNRASCRDRDRDRQRDEMRKPSAATVWAPCAVKGGMGRKAAIDVIGELHETARAGLDRTLSSLPKDFPDRVASAIAAAFRQRVDRLPSVLMARSEPSSLAT